MSFTDYFSRKIIRDLKHKCATKTGTETLTNKTLTSPKINEDVAVTATATEMNKLHGIGTASHHYIAQIAYATITHTDNGVSLFTLPPYSSIYSFNLYTYDGFSGGSSPTYSLGIEGNATYLVNAAPLPTTSNTYAGISTASVNGAAIENMAWEWDGEPIEIIGTFGGSATHGNAALRIAYSIDLG